MVFSPISYTRLFFFILFPAILVEVVQSFSPQSSTVINSSSSSNSNSNSNSNNNSNNGRGSKSNTQTRIDTTLHATRGNGASSTREKNFLMDDFRTADGVILNPYKTLHIDRKATHTEIRQSYRTLSKKYHPDACRFKTIMPGSCNDLDDVRDEWERIKLSYEILSDPKMRKRYDRHSSLNDPGAAFGRAALDTVGWGMAGLAKGVFAVGKSAVNVATKKGEKGRKGKVQLDGEDGTIVKLNMKRVERKQRMVQHIHLGEESPLSNDTSSGRDRNTRRQRQRQPYQPVAVASSTASYAPLAIIDYSVNHKNNLLEDILVLAVALTNALSFNNKGPLESTSATDLDWSFGTSESIFGLEIPEWLQTIHQTTILPFQENFVDAVEKCFNHFLE